MKTPVESRVARAIAFFAVALTLVSLVGFGADVAIGTAIGGAIAVADFQLVRWAGAILLRGSVRGKAIVGVLLAMKLGLLGLLLFALVVLLDVHAGGLVLGLGSLALGIVVGAGSHAALRAPHTPGET